MTREIKFRAWDKVEKRFAFYQLLNGVINWMSDFISFDGNRDKDLQYTGLKDKNGKKIYEGDIVKSDNGLIWEVKFGDYQYSLESFPATGWYMDGKNCQFPLFQKDMTNEIIGNIYEHPKLLNNKKLK